MKLYKNQIKTYLEEYKYIAKDKEIKQLLTKDLIISEFDYESESVSKYEHKDKQRRIIYDNCLFF